MSTKYNVIVADPPWGFKNYKKAAHGSPQYPTMNVEEMGEIPVKQWANKECLLLMWCTWPMLREGVKLMDLWGFDYITGFPWIKTIPTSGTIRCGIGFWTQSVSEFVMVGKLGKISPPKKDKRRGLLFGEDRQFYGPINKHSTKPEDIQDWVENRFEGPFLELFARRERPDWTCWGYDTGYKLHKNGVEKIHV